MCSCKRQSEKVKIDQSVKATSLLLWHVMASETLPEIHLKLSVSLETKTAAASLVPPQEKRPCRRPARRSVSPRKRLDAEALVWATLPGLAGREDGSRVEDSRNKKAGTGPGCWTMTPGVSPLTTCPHVEDFRACGRVCTKVHIHRLWRVCAGLRSANRH